MNYELLQVSPWLKNKSMKNVVINNPSKRQLATGFMKLLPNVRKFKVIVKEKDWLFEAHGLDKRVNPEFVYEKHENGRANRYLTHQYRRLEHCAKTNPLKFWRIGMHLVRKSNIFLITALNHVFPKWHRNIALSKVISMAIKTRRIALCPDPTLNVTRTYIAKANGKIRGLGVPTPEWRIYLHMVNEILTWYLELSGQQHPNQHGFRPKRGSLTAWTQILKEVIKAKDIYEFDLKNFFPSVNLDYISKKLVEKGVPINIVKRLYFINCAATQIKPPYLLNEFEEMMKRLITNGKSMSEVVNAPRPLSYMYRVRGVPQGAPTSPVLATLALEGSIIDRPNLNCLMYADDGLYYGDIKDPIITPNSGMVSANIYFNLTKSGWVKKEGVWLKPLKFLGKEFDGKKLRASTRKGSTLEYDKQDLIQDILGLDPNPPYPQDEMQDQSTWENLIKSKLFGYIQSRMYAGSWNLEEFIQQFEYDFKNQSWAYKSKAKNNINVFNSTSYASNWMAHKLSHMKSMKRL